MKTGIPLFRKSRLAISVAAIHILCVLQACRFIINGTESDWPMVWAIFYLVDGPLMWISVAFPHFSHWTFFSGGETAPLNDPNNFWKPALISGILGTVQWFFITKYITRLFRMRATTKDTQSVALENDNPPRDV